MVRRWRTAAWLHCGSRLLTIRVLDKESVLVRCGLIFVALTVAALVLALVAPWWLLRAGLLWLAFSLALMGAAYLGAGPRVLMKRPNGRLHPVSWLLLWPFHLLNKFVFSIYHFVSSEPPWAEVIPGLILGRRLWCWEARRLGEARVLDLTAEFTEPRCMRTRAGYQCLPVLDNGCPALEQIEAGVAWLREHHPRGRVYVHCAAGHGRSATIVAAYLLSMGMAASVAEVTALLKSKRPRVYLNLDQRVGLQSFVPR